MTHRTDIKTTAGAILLALALALAVAAADAADAPQRTYPSGFKVALKLGGELYEALPDKFANQVDAQAISLQPQDVPVVSPVAVTEDSRVVRQVSVSAGFIDLANHICHAKAVDRIQPGFFEQYVNNLLRVTGEDFAVQPPGIVDPRYWTDDVMNDQLSYFNQMIGMIVAVNLSHHYLGHFAKYAPRMIGAGNKTTPINTFLTEAEWDVTIKAGVVNALNCALATDGPRALFEAIDKMPHRPQWTAYILPQYVDVKKLNLKLAKYEDDFFHGRLKP
ncbi:MAG: hypothetical protein ABSG59_15670 [Verrucomicrobiota bacterium]|jgi:hypothetical protein